MICSCFSTRKMNKCVYFVAKHCDFLLFFLCRIISKAKVHAAVVFFYMIILSFLIFLNRKNRERLLKWRSDPKVSLKRWEATTIEIWSTGQGHRFTEYPFVIERFRRPLFTTHTWNYIPNVDLAHRGGQHRSKCGCGKWGQRSSIRKVSPFAFRRDPVATFEYSVLLGNGSFYLAYQVLQPTTERFETKNSVQCWGLAVQLQDL